MKDPRGMDSDELLDKAMLVKQSLKFADDLVEVYEQEKLKRHELESINEKLRLEMAERELAEQALRESEERFRAIFETADDCIYIKDRFLKYTHVNPAMERLLQLSGSKIIGKTDEQLFGKGAGRHLREIDLRVLAGESIEEEHTRPVNGSATTFLETRAPLVTGSGEIAGVCGIARNITDRKGTPSGKRTSEGKYQSKSMRAALAKARQVASQDTVILLSGESGSGKDYMAGYIHKNSPRASGPFFAINCAAVPPELAESELFGHEAGAFTGATARKRGLLELAEGGSLFLNEVGDLSQVLQAKLLTFLDTREFTRIGGEKSISVKARLITATNKDLENEVAEGRFRQDLFYRLNVFAIRIPPLRERKADIPVLVKQIASSLQAEMRLHSPPEFDSGAIEALKNWHWPGNVRELRNLLERVLILSGGGKLNASHLGLGQTQQEWRFSTGFPESNSLNEVTMDLKRALVVEALRRSGDSRVEAARLLGISRNSLNHYLARLGIKD